MYTKKARAISRVVLSALSHGQYLETSPKRDWITQEWLETMRLWYGEFVHYLKRDAPRMAKICGIDNSTYGFYKL